MNLADCYTGPVPAALAKAKERQALCERKIDRWRRRLANAQAKVATFSVAQPVFASEYKPKPAGEFHTCFTHVTAQDKTINWPPTFPLGDASGGLVTAMDGWEWMPPAKDQPMQQFWQCVHYPSVIENWDRKRPYGWCAECTFQAKNDLRETNHECKPTTF